MAAESLDLTIDDISEAVSAAAAGTEVLRVYLFGSRARGDNRLDSDIDLSVETGPEFSLIDAGFFQDSVEQACHRSVDLASEEFMLPSMRETVQREKVLVYER